MSKDIWLDIIEQMKQRRQIGLDTYSVPVTADKNVNWRNHLNEELLDALCYNYACSEMENKYKILLKYASALTNTTEEELENKLYGS